MPRAWGKGGWSELIPNKHHAIVEVVFFEVMHEDIGHPFALLDTDVAL